MMLKTLIYTCTYNEESDGEVEIHYDDSEEESSSDNDETITNDTNTEAADTTNEESFTSPNGIEWLTEKPRGRLLARNIIITFIQALQFNQALKVSRSRSSSLSQYSGQFCDIPIEEWLLLVESLSRMQS